jgi:hypothetical protein
MQRGQTRERLVALGTRQPEDPGSRDLTGVSVAAERFRAATQLEVLGIDSSAGSLT